MMTSLVLLALLAESSALQLAHSQTLEWASVQGLEKDTRLTVNLTVDGKKSQLRMTLDVARGTPSRWVTVTTLDQTLSTEEFTGRFVRAVPIRVVGSAGPQVLVMSIPGNSTEYDLFSVVDRQILRTFHYKTRLDESAKWRTKNGRLTEIEVFDRFGFDEGEYLAHPMKDGKVWVANRIYRWDKASSSWKTMSDKRLYHDLDHETMKDSLGQETKVWFAYK